ncbi:hypothetical protein P7C70_g5040, partial [Phenoliferia sp. Uapishka_3]
MSASPSSSKAGRELEEEDDIERHGSASDQGGKPRRPTKKRARKGEGTGEKKHVCSWPDCNKSSRGHEVLRSLGACALTRFSCAAFSRTDHLTRHTLNHTPLQIYTCERCSKAFVRNDLLVRHVERHVKRELAVTEGGQVRPTPADSAPRNTPPAGGPPPLPSTSLANLPYPPQARSPSWKERGAPHPRTFFDYDKRGSGTSPHLGQQLSDSAPSASYQSPAQNTAVLSANHDTSHSTTSPLVNALYSNSHVPSPYHPEMSQTSFDSTSPFFQESMISHPATSLRGMEDPLHFIQASYGAPFTSANEYSWLFDASQNFNVTLGSSRPASPGPSEFDSLAFGMGLSSGSMSFDLGDGQGLHTFGMPEHQWGERDSDKVEQNFASQSLLSAVEAGANREVEIAKPEVADTEFLETRDPSTFIDPSTRLRILDYLGPEWVGLRGDSRMSTKAMSNYLKLFWTRVHETQAPAVHRASLRTEAAPTPLLLAMMLLGCYFAEKEAHALAVKLHPMFRGKVFCSTDFRPRAELWLHQTALLIIVFGKLCSNRMAHEMSHIFWSSVVTLGRRSGLYSQRTVEVPNESRADVEVLWAAWIEEEVAKRVAHVGFSIDVQHAALFRHSPALSAFQIQITLPSDEDEWEAPTAVEWARIHAHSRTPIPFISALKASLTAGVAQPRMPHFIHLSRRQV